VSPGFAFTVVLSSGFTLSQCPPSPSGLRVSWKGWLLKVPSMETMLRAGSLSLASWGSRRNVQGVSLSGLAGRRRVVWKMIGVTVFVIALSYILRHHECRHLLILLYLNISIYGGIVDM